MNTPSEFPRQQPLLDSLLAETAPPEFRAAVLKQTLACARRRQTRRRAGTLALASALVLLVAAPALRHARPTPPRLAASSQPAPRVVPGTQIRIDQTRRRRRKRGFHPPAGGLPQLEL